MDAPKGRLSQLGEFGWLKQLIPRLYWPSSLRPQLCIGAGDDAGVVRISPGKALVTTTDTLVEGDETVTLSISSGFLLTEGGQTTHVVTIIDGPVITDDYPATPYIENVGVRPEVVNDYMTRDNLLQGGAPFVRDFLDSMAAYVRTL